MTIFASSNEFLMIILQMKKPSIKMNCNWKLHFNDFYIKTEFFFYKLWGMSSEYIFFAYFCDKFSFRRKLKIFHVIYGILFCHFLRGYKREIPKRFWYESKLNCIPLIFSLSFPSFSLPSITLYFNLFGGKSHEF